MKHQTFDCTFGCAATKEQVRFSRLDASGLGRARYR
jgi:hypothetical protein